MNYTRKSPRLSICIATFNRADVIGETLDRLLAQLTDTVEVIVVDGASTDGTEALLKSYAGRHLAIRYYRELTNSGVDQDFDKAVAYASGDYCWLLPDDDLIRSQAVRKVVDLLSDHPALLVIDASVWSADFKQELQDSRMSLKQNLRFERADDEFLVAAGDQLSYIGAVVIRRDEWLRRERTQYFGSLFIHVGVILQQPALGPIKVAAEPMILIRYGNAMWKPRSFEIWMFMWPRFIWSFPAFSDYAKHRVCSRHPYLNPLELLKHRAKGSYGLGEFNRFIAFRVRGINRWLARLIALIPGRVANVIAVLYVVTLSRHSQLGLSDLLGSPNASYVSRFIADLLAPRRMDAP